MEGATQKQPFLRQKNAQLGGAGSDRVYKVLSSGEDADENWNVSDIVPVRKSCHVCCSQQIGRRTARPQEGKSVAFTFLGEVIQFTNDGIKTKHINTKLPGRDTNVQAKVEAARESGCSGCKKVKATKK